MRTDLANDPIGERAKEECEEETDRDEDLTPPRVREGENYGKSVTVNDKERMSSRDPG